ncbi:MAG: hypothetical protein H3C68_04870 [Deltaproteobacteria bacterium]|nr:hypothetical protein [Deltaproteobacteria bacterium]MBZ0220059.1 hypothetical protein [Deltaproteobacteria bacterium]
MKNAFLALLLITPSALLAGERHPERDYQSYWCGLAGGTAEFVLPDRARVDCLTDEHAVEVDFAPKWAEAIGQSLYYAAVTGKKPGILLIMRDEGDTRYLERLFRASAGLGITVWTASSVDMKAGGGPSFQARIE